ncbi:MAG: hypothetical protein ACJAYU_003373 [Bradymonadia bacterium]
MALFAALGLGLGCAADTPNNSDTADGLETPSDDTAVEVRPATDGGPSNDTTELDDTLSLDADDDGGADTLPDSSTDASVDSGPLTGKCGDGIVDANEECDDGPDNRSEACEPAFGEASCEYCSVNCRSELVEVGVEVGSIEGWVLLHADSSPIAGAEITVPGGATARSDEDGHFRMEGVPAGERVLVSVARATESSENPYSSTQVAVGVLLGQTSFVYPRLLTGCSAFVEVSVATGGVAEPNEHCTTQGGRASIAITASGLARADGSTFSGTARVDIIPMPIPQGADGPDLSAWNAFPGDMRAVRVDDSPAELQSYGAAEIRVLDADSGDELQIAEGQTARLRLQVYAQPETLAPVTAWWFDESRGLWVEEGTGAFYVEDGITYYDIEVEHLTWWNCDEPLRNKTCIWGTVIADGDRPFPRVQVSADGVDYAGTSRGYTDSTGRFCVNVRPESIVRLNIPTGRLDGYPADLASVVASNGSGNSCETFIGDCVYIGELPNSPVIEDFPAPPDVPAPPPPDVPDSVCVNTQITAAGALPVGTDVTVTAFDGFHTPVWSAEIGSDQRTGDLCANIPGIATRLSLEWTAPDGRPCLHTEPITVGSEEAACGVSACIEIGALSCG